MLQYWRLALPDHDVIDRAELLADELVTNVVWRTLRLWRQPAAGPASGP